MSSSFNVHSCTQNVLYITQVRNVTQMLHVLIILLVVQTVMASSFNVLLHKMFKINHILLTFIKVKLVKCFVVAFLKGVCWTLFSVTSKLFKLTCPVVLMFILLHKKFNILQPNGFFIQVRIITQMFRNVPFWKVFVELCS